MINRFISEVGLKIIMLIEGVGSAIIFLVSSMSGIAKVIFSKNKLIRKSVIDQLFSFGIKSFPMVAVVSLFMGMVLVIQLVPEFKKFSAESFSGGTIALAIARELGPIITAIIVAGRVGSAIAAEVGSMKVTEQIAALEVMAVNPLFYLVSPRILSGIVMLPILTLVADLFAIGGAYWIGVYGMGLVSGTFFNNVEKLVTLNDFLGGLFKSIFFGIIITTVACYKGMGVKGGAEGVGEATTDAVVIAIMTILVVDFIISTLMYGQYF